MLMESTVNVVQGDTIKDLADPMNQVTMGTMNIVGDS